MGSIRKNDSKSFQHVQDRFAGEVGKLFDKEHPSAVSSLKVEVD